MLYIAEEEGQAVATIRSDLSCDGVVELSWTVAPAHRGKGVGKKAVLQFVEELHKNKRLRATIKKGNKPSESIALSLGLHPLEGQSLFTIWEN